MLLLPITNLSVTAAITTTASTPAITLNTAHPVGQVVYSVRATQNCWVLVGTTPTAVAGTGSHYLPLGVEMFCDGNAGAHISVKADSTSGSVTITPMIRT